MLTVQRAREIELAESAEVAVASGDAGTKEL
jgi:hypothetical protein